MLTIAGAVYLSIAGLSLIPFGILGWFGGKLSSVHPAKTTSLVLLSAATWPVSLRSWAYSIVKSK